MSTKFEDQVMPLKPRLYAKAMSLTANRADAEDLVQNTLVKAYVNWHQFQQGTNLPGWLLRILCNSFYNDYRKAQRRPERLVGDHNDLEPVHKASSAEATALDESIDPSLRRAVEELAEPFRNVFCMMVAGYSYKEISASEEIPIGTVMSRLHRARKKIFTNLAKAEAV